MVPQLSVNPFSLLMDSAAVLQAVERSVALGGLQARIFRPLDGRGSSSSSVVTECSAYDAAVEADDTPIDTDNGSY